MIKPYGQSLALLTDLYQLTMAHGYWREGVADREAVFHHFFRRAPFGGTFAVAAGLDTALRWLAGLRFREDDLEYLAGLTGQGGRTLFAPGFLDYLRDFAFKCDLEAMPEGTAVFPQEPIIRVRGPLLHCQLAETGLLNIVNFQTLVATKAARVCLAAAGDPVLEFGLRRSQGIDGGLHASRAAYIGGCAATSNVLAGKLYGLPVGGTHAHSWVLAFDDELEAFEAFARAMPHNCILLVDTYDTIAGVRKAIEVGVRLRERGHRLLGVRLDSGDLGALSMQVRRMLDEAGLESTQVVASNDLDEYSVETLKQRGAKIGVWGVGTSIAAATGDAALGGVYKLSLLKNPAGIWQDKSKRSEDPAKASTPGMLQVRRFSNRAGATADLIYDELRGCGGNWSGSSFDDANGVRRIEFQGAHEDLLRPALRQGRPVGPRGTPADARLRCKAQLAALPRPVLRLREPCAYPVIVEDGLMRRRKSLLG